MITISFDASRQTLIGGENFRRVYRLGDKVRVRWRQLIWMIARSI